MTETSPDRSLHFAVRHPNYSQHEGYGIYMNQVLQDLNAHPPQNARELLVNAAELMSRKLEYLKGEKVYHTSTLQPENFDTEQQLHKLKKISEIPDYQQMSFGPITAEKFGLLQFTHHNQLLTTPILTKKEQGEPSAYRGYFAAFERNIENKDWQQDIGISADTLGEILDRTNSFNISFRYPPGKVNALKLMQIIGGDDLLDQIIRIVFTRELDAEQRVKIIGQNEDKKVLFLHPLVTEDYFNKLTDHMEPLIKTIDALEEKAMAEKQVPEGKLEAMATIYWLAAQSTPVTRGGSAYANLILEHLSHRLQQQGYEFELPYMKDGIDLWAEAATTKLDVFKDRFASGAYFDRNLTDEMVKEKLGALKQQQSTKQKQPDSIVNESAHIPGSTDLSRSLPD